MISASALVLARFVGLVANAVTDLVIDQVLAIAVRVTGEEIAPRTHRASLMSTCRVGG